jgi:aspartate aminotransferase-like enzyme
MKALGLRLYAPQAPSDALTAVVAPPGVDGEKLVKILEEKHHFTIAGGQDQAKGKVFRLAHMGYLGPADILAAVCALEMTLKELGHPFDPGAGARAAMEIFGQG